jgi:hypothetical protein
MASALTVILSNIRLHIPEEILNLAFEPTKYNTTVEQRIIGEIIEGPVLIETSLIAGRRRELVIDPSWEMMLPADRDNIQFSQLTQGTYYEIPPEAREGRTITSVLGFGSSLVTTFPNAPGEMAHGVQYGNTLSSMLNDMLASRTLGQFSSGPQATLEGPNIICFSPRLYSGAIIVAVTLGYEPEFTNMNPSAILALSEFALAVTKRYIYNTLVVKLDETEVVSGMELGVVKDIVRSYDDDSKNLRELLIKLRGASLYDSRTISRLAFAAL